MDPIQLVRQAIAAYEAGGIEALAPFYHPDAEIVGGPFFGPKNSYKGGVDGIRSLHGDLSEGGHEVKATPTNLRPGGTPDRVLVDGVVSSTLTDGRPGEAYRSWWLVWVRDGKIGRLEIFHEESQALAAAGLSA
jgi:ketosteroid isomerase-like protein